MIEAPPVLTAGVDAGSSAVKAVVIRSRGGHAAETLSIASQRIRRRHVHDVARQTFADACAAAGVRPEQLAYVASTGDGDAVPFRTGHFYSMTTHARGALELVPGARALLDVGALHARAIRMDARGRVLAHRMTSQCASGSGQFLENIARYLGVPLDDVGPLSRTATRAEGVSSICAVLAETDVINMVSRGLSAADILRGIHDSIAGRLVRLARATGAQGAVVVTGGLSRDEGLLDAIRAHAPSNAPAAPPLDIVTHADAPVAGALGAALLAAYRYDQLEKAGRLP